MYRFTDILKKKLTEIKYAMKFLEVRKNNSIVSNWPYKENNYT